MPVHIAMESRRWDVMVVRLKEFLKLTFEKKATADEVFAANQAGQSLHQLPQIKLFLHQTNLAKGTYFESIQTPKELPAN